MWTWNRRRANGMSRQTGKQASSETHVERLAMIDVVGYAKKHGMATGDPRPRAHARNAMAQNEVRGILATLFAGRHSVGVDGVGKGEMSRGQARV